MQNEHVCDVTFHTYHYFTNIKVDFLLEIGIFKGLSWGCGRGYKSNLETLATSSRGK